MQVTYPDMSFLTYFLTLSLIVYITHISLSIKWPLLRLSAQLSLSCYIQWRLSAQLRLHYHTHFTQSSLLFSFLFFFLFIYIYGHSWDSLPSLVSDLTHACIYIITWMATPETLCPAQSQAVELSLHTHIFLTIPHIPHIMPYAYISSFSQHVKMHMYNYIITI